MESIEKANERVRDVVCGYGAIGIYLRDNFDCTVDMIDVNERAISLSKKNIELNNLNNIDAFISDCYKNVSHLYDYIITNPPIRAGKKKVYEILFDANDHLKEDGKLIIVIRKDQGAKSTLKDLEKVYNTKIINKRSGFFVILAKKVNKRQKNQ